MIGVDVMQYSSENLLSHARQGNNFTELVVLERGRVFGSEAICEESVGAKVGAPSEHDGAVDREDLSINAEPQIRKPTTIQRNLEVKRKKRGRSNCAQESRLCAAPNPLGRHQRTVHRERVLSP